MSKSLDYKVPEATEVIMELTDAEAVKAFTENDTRKGVTDAADVRLAELEAEAESKKNTGADRAAGSEQPFIHPKLDETQRKIMAHPFHTIHILENRDEPDYVPVNVSGTKDGRDFEIRKMIRRGVNVDNVPRELVYVLYGAVETHYRDEEKKNDPKGGNRLVPYKVRRYPFSIIDSYDSPKAE